MTNVNSNNYSNSEALLKRLQMKNLMDGKKEEVQEQQEQGRPQEHGDCGGQGDLLSHQPQRQDVRSKSDHAGPFLRRYGGAGYLLSGEIRFR